MFIFNSLKTSSFIFTQFHILNCVCVWSDEREIYIILGQSEREQCDVWREANACQFDLANFGCLSLS